VTTPLLHTEYVIHSSCTTRHPPIQDGAVMDVEEARARTVVIEITYGGHNRWAAKISGHDESRTFTIKVKLDDFANLVELLREFSTAQKALELLRRAARRKYRTAKDDPGAKSPLSFVDVTRTIELTEEAFAAITRRSVYERTIYLFM